MASQFVEDFLALITRDWAFSGSDNRARCPGHNGQDRNLVVTIDNDKIITYCHSHQCSHGLILENMGLKYSDQASPKPVQKTSYAWVTTAGRKVDHYRIDGPEGKRMGWRPKGFTLQPGEKFLPFQRGSATAHTIGVFEGEKTVLAAASQLGQNMLCCTWGGRKLESIDWSLCRQKNVILWPDFDQAGYRQMTKVGRKIQDVLPKNIEVVLLQSVPYKSDASDYSDLNWDLDYLLNTHRHAFTGKMLAPVLQPVEGGLQTGLIFSNLKLVLNTRKNMSQIMTTGGGSNPLDLKPVDRCDYDDLAQAKFRQHLQLNFSFLKKTKDGAVFTPAKFTDQDWKLSNNAHLFTHQVDPFKTEYLDTIKPVQDDNLLENWADDLYNISATSRPFSTWFSRYFFLGIVSRTLNPGCMLDTIPVLIGQENAGKSSLGRCVLPPAFAEEGFADIDLGADSKEFYESIQGRIVVEAPEISGYSKQDQNKIKANLTRQVDTPRLAYGREPVTKPRRVIIFATSNEELPLMNTGTGNRRFCVIQLNGRANYRLENYFEERRDKLFAAALFAYRRGDKAVFPTDLQDLQKETNDTFEASDQTLIDMIDNTKWGSPPLGQPGWLLLDIAHDLFGLGPEALKFARDKHYRLAKSLRRCGFDRDENARVNPKTGKRVRFWYPPKYIKKDNVDDHDTRIYM